MNEPLPICVLLVDDETEFVETVTERLATRGFDAQSATSGEEALALIRQEPPNVIILDLKMPGMDGLEVLERIKSLYAGLPVIMLTGHGSAKEEAVARDLGAFAYLPKPQKIEKLVRVINDALSR